MDDRTKLLHSLAIDRSRPSAPSRARRWPLWTLAALGMIAVAGGVLWFAVPREPADDAGNPVEVARAESVLVPGTAEPTTATTAIVPARRAGLSASGYVVARRRATVAAEITGKVVEVLAEEGMEVEEGQVLARIKSRLTETDLALARSRANAAEAAAAAISADLREAGRVLKRTQQLAKKDFASEAAKTRAESQVHVLRAKLAQAQAQFETAKLQARRFSEVLEQHNVRAPFSGIVVHRSAQPGEMISPLSAGGSYTRTGICTIVDMDSLEIEVDVNEAFIGRVKRDGAVTAVLDAYPDWSIPAYVIAIVPTANREKATVRVRIGFKEKDERVLPDMAVKVTVHEDDGLPGKKTSAVQ